VFLCVCVCVCVLVSLCSYKILLIGIHLEENMDVNWISNYVIRGHYLHVTLLPLPFTAQQLAVSFLNSVGQFCSPPPKKEVQ
jgi:hypothetical protein